MKNGYLKIGFIPVLLLFSCDLLFAQQVPVPGEQLENLIPAEESREEADQYLEDLDDYKKHPLNINTADAASLLQLGLVTQVQVDHLIHYRELLGELIDLYELQALPGWDLQTIRKLIPYICIKSPTRLAGSMKAIQKGTHSFLLRVSESFGITGENGGNKNKYKGSLQSVLFRYRYNYKNLVRWGVTGDKDAGECFLRRGQRSGFDFYSFHFSASNVGILKSIAIGDYTVNMGQGLVQWQGLSFRKSADAMAINKQSPIIRSYSSAGEYYFFRGLGLTIKKRHVGGAAFISLRRTDANLAVDSNRHIEVISSFLTNGYHRTKQELDNRNNIKQFVTGGNLSYSGKQWHAGLNIAYWKFSDPVQKRNEPYNLYALQGNSFLNSSIDYRYTYRNFHFFGEFAIDRYMNKAFLNGVLISVDSRIDLSLLHRKIEPAYQVVNGNAFTENTVPGNESGFYAGLTYRPASSWRLDAYVDLFQFPWLKYAVDLPSAGSEFFIQVKYTPSKQLELSSRFRKEIKQANQTIDRMPMHAIVKTIRQNWRTHLDYKVNRHFSIRNRVELVWYNDYNNKPQEGFLTFLDFLYKPMSRPYSLIARLQYFESAGYDARVYAYENDVMYIYNVPSFSGKGIRYYLVAGYDFSKNLSGWLKIGKTGTPEEKFNNLPAPAGTNIAGNTDIRVQLRYVFN